MKCRTVVDLGASFVDGELAATDAERIQSHVAACGACAGVIEEIKARAKLLGQAERAHPPAGAWSRLEAALDRPIARPHRRMWPWVASAAAALILAALWVFPWRQRPPKYFQVVVRDRAEAFDRDERTAVIEESQFGGGVPIVFAAPAAEPNR